MQTRDCDSVGHRNTMIDVCLEGRSKQPPASPNCLPADVETAIVDELCEETKKMCQLQFGDSLLSLVLTGSLARGEGTFSLKNGAWQPLSDAEFIVTLADSAQLPAAQKQ